MGGKAPQIFRCKGVEKPPLYNFGNVLAVLKNTCKSVEGTMGSDAAPSSSALIMKNGCPTKEYGNSFAAAVGSDLGAGGYPLPATRLRARGLHRPGSLPP